MLEIRSIQNNGKLTHHRLQGSLGHVYDKALLPGRAHCSDPRRHPPNNRVVQPSTTAAGRSGGCNAKIGRGISNKIVKEMEMHIKFQALLIHVGKYIWHDISLLRSSVKIALVSLIFQADSSFCSKIIIEYILNNAKFKCKMSD